MQLGAVMGPCGRARRCKLPVRRWRLTVRHSGSTCCRATSTHVAPPVLAVHTNAHRVQYRVDHGSAARRLLRRAVQRLPQRWCDVRQAIEQGRGHIPENRPGVSGLGVDDDAARVEVRRERGQPALADAKEVHAGVRVQHAQALPFVPRDILVPVLAVVLDADHKGGSVILGGAPARVRRHADEGVDQGVLVATALALEYGLLCDGLLHGGEQVGEHPGLLVGMYPPWQGVIRSHRPCSAVQRRAGGAPGRAGQIDICMGQVVFGACDRRSHAKPSSDFWWCRVYWLRRHCMLV